MALPDQQLRSILVEEQYLSEEDVVRGEEHGKERGLSLRDALFELGLLTQNLYEDAIAEHFHLPYFGVQSSPPTAETVSMLPEEIARTFNAVVVKYEDGAATVATSDPGHPQLEEALRLNIGQKTGVFPVVGRDETKKKESKDAPEERPAYSGTISFVYAPQLIIESLLVRYRKPLETRFQAIITEKKKVAPEILEEILSDAIEMRASDVHFEPREDTVVVRFRVDGVMHEAGRIPKEFYEGVLNRIKIAANLHIDQHFAAQDGAIRHKTKTGTMDIRVSIVPIVDGEKVVLRLLSEYVRTLTLGDLGFSEQQQQLLDKVAHKPFGMILTTGPTGSGKSTTLYALMKIRNQPDINISTIEDPVEYKIPGINHIQVNAETELTFANGLRALVRQDPNIILVGEIRDGETASIAVNAALTGHLLFSTLHANDAPTAVPRLLEMGVEPFLLASTLEVIAAQRLMRRICPECRYSYDIPLQDAAKLFPGADRFFKSTGKGGVVRLYKGKGCGACSNTGFRGRLGIYELLVVTPEIEELIIRRASSSEIQQRARQQGMKLLFEDGFDKLIAGITTIEELVRVAAPPDLLFSADDDSKK